MDETLDAILRKHSNICSYQYEIKVIHCHDNIGGFHDNTWSLLRHEIALHKTIELLFESKSDFRHKKNILINYSYKPRKCQRNEDQFNKSYAYACHYHRKIWCDNVHD